LPSVCDKAIILQRFSAVSKSLGNIGIAKKYQGKANDIYKKLIALIIYWLIIIIWGEYIKRLKLETKQVS
jgi:hypothetical protein